MADTRSNAIEDTVGHEDHWGYDATARRRIGVAMHRYGIDPTNKTDFQCIFGVGELKHYAGSIDDALEAIQDFGMERYGDFVESLGKTEDIEPVHSEAKTVAWANILTPDGIQISVTAREGATETSVAKTVLALTGAIELLKSVGFKARKA